MKRVQGALDVVYSGGDFCAAGSVWKGAVPTTWTQTSFTDTDLVISVQALNNPDLWWNARGVYCTVGKISWRPLSGVVVLNLASILLPDGTPSLN